MKRQKNNKGFSLVELIVVVAIMAVLVGVLAPAYLRYVEKARRQTCYWNMDNVVREVQLRAFSDPEFMDDLVEEANGVTIADVTEFVRGTDDITRIKKCARLKNQQKQTVFYVKNHQSSGYDRGPDLI